MANIIYGDELSTWETIAIMFGESKKDNSQGRKSKYAFLKVRDAKHTTARPRNIPFFDDDAPELVKMCEELKQPDPFRADGHIVPLSATGCRVTKKGRGRRMELDVEITAPDNVYAPAFAQDWMLFDGLGTMPMKLRKGWCYANDVDGKPRISTRTNQPLMTDTVTVLVQVDYKETDDNGRTVTHYVEPFSPETQLKRVEDRFYMHAVPTDKIPGATAATAPKTDDVAPNPGNADGAQPDTNDATDPVVDF